MGRRKVTIEQIGSIGELIAAIATVATLVYLAAQIRQNSKLFRTSVTMATREGRAEMNRIMATDDQANRVFFEGLLSRSDLSEPDRRKFDALMSIVYETWEHDFDLGIGLRKLSSFMTDRPGWRQWWEVYRDYYPSEFQVFLDSQLTPVSPAASQSPNPTLPEHGSLES